MFHRFTSHISVLKCVNATLLMVLLVAVGGVSYAAPSSPWKFDFSAGNGITLSYQDIPLITKSTLQVTAPDWMKTFYSQPSQQTEIQKQADGSWQITGSSDYFRAEYELHPLDAQTFEMRFRGELLKDVPAQIEFNAGYFNSNLFVNCPFVAQIRATKDSPERIISGIVPAFPAKEGLAINDLAPNFQNLDVDSRLGKMTLKILSPSPVIFADARNYPHFKDSGSFFWCGWLAGMQPLSVGHPVEMTLTLHIEHPASQAPQNISLSPVTAPVTDAFVPNQQPVLIVPKPKEMQLNTATHFVLRDTSQWSVTAPAGETRLTAAVQSLLGDDWDLKLNVPQINNSTSNGWCGISLGDAKPILFPADLANADWAIHPDSYQLTVDKGGIKIVAPTARGAFYGVQTLAQMLRSGDKAVNVPFAEIRDWPTLQFRGAHWFPSKSAVPFDKKLIHILARYKFNYTVIDCGMAQWDSNPKLARPNSISKKDLRDLVDLCRANFIEPIPLINGPGHAEWMFSNGQNLDLAEDSKTPYAYSVNNPDSLTFVHEVMKEMIDIFHPKFFHIGGDEVTYRGRFPNPDNRYYRKGQSATDLILSNLREQHDWLAKRGIKTMMWGDMFLNKKEGAYAANASTVEEAQARRDAIPKDVLVTDWQYGDADKYPSMDLFQKEGLTTVASSWHSPLNVRNFTQAAIENKSWGVLQTSWTSRIPDEKALAIGASDFSAFILAADYSWSGRSEFPDALPYDPATRWAQAYIPHIHTQRDGDLLDLDTVASVAAESWLGLGKGRNLVDFFAQQKGVAIRRFEGIDFRIPDRHFVVLSPDPSIMAPAGALQELILDVNQKATDIAFLHSTLWNVPNGTTAAICTVEYADGTHCEVNFMTGENIASWEGAPVVGSAVKAWIGTLLSGEVTNLQIFRWNNPYPDKTITSVRLQPVDAQAGYVLAGITLIQ